MNMASIVVGVTVFYKTERKTHPSECGWDVSDKKLDFLKIKLYICINSGFGMQSEDKQKQVEALTLVKSVKLEAQPISFAVGG
jgi:hypothetical protein